MGSVSPPAQFSRHRSILGPHYADAEFEHSAVELLGRSQFHDTQYEQDPATQWEGTRSSAIDQIDESQQSRSPRGPDHDSRGSESATIEENGLQGGSEVEVASGRQPFVAAKLNYETILADILCIGLPIALLVFTILLSSKSGMEAPPDHIAKWRNAAAVLSTLFPLLFAAITGRFMTQIARWKLEKGASIGSLEQLLGSRTVGGAFLTQFHLRAFNVLGFGVILLWALSPLGSQAILRLVEQRLIASTINGEIKYFDSLRNIVEGEPPPPSGTREAEYNGSITVMDTIYGAMILGTSAIKNSSMDLWGNVKIPKLASNNNSDWRDIAPGSLVVYHSLLGIPVMGIPSGNTTFNMESSYIELQCDPINVWQTFPMGVGSATSNTTEGYLNSTYLDSIGGIGRVPVAQPVNGSFQGHGGVRGGSLRVTSWSIGLDRFINRRWISKAWNPVDFVNETGIETGPTRMMFQVFITETMRFSPVYRIGTYCDVKQRYVETKIICEKPNQSARQNCTAVSQRRSQKYNLDENLSILNWPSSFRYLSVYWPLSTGPRTPGQVGTRSDQDLVIQYLFDPTMENLSSASAGAAVQNISATELSIRLTQALNTYAQLRPMGFLALNFQNDDDRDVTYPKTARTTGDAMQKKIVFGIPHVWSAFSLIACIVLLAGGIASSVYAHMAIGPELLGYVTTVFRKTSLELPEEKESLDGITLGFELRKRRIRYGLSLGEDGLPMVGDQDTTARIKNKVKA